MSDDTPISSRDFACSRCGKALSTGRGEFYFVDIRAVVEPSSPIFLDADLARDTEIEIAKLLKKIESLTEEELLGEVYRRNLFTLCPRCYTEWMSDPFGLNSSGPASRT